MRSGVLTSVHAFAVDPKRGVFSSTILVVLHRRRARRSSPGARRSCKQGGLFAPVSREGALVLNNVLLTTACATVLVGTLYPLALRMPHRRQDLGGSALLQSHLRAADGFRSWSAMPFGPYLAWKRGDLYGAAQRLFAAALIALVALIVAFALYWRGPWLAPFGIALGVWIVAGAISEWVSRVKLFAAGTDEIWRRARGLPRSAYGTTLAHAGIGLSVLGIVATSAWQSESVVTMRAGDTTEIAGYALTFRGVAPAQGPNYQEQVGLLTVTRGGAPVTELRPAKRLYDAPRMPTTEAAIHVVPAGDLYVVLGDELKDGAGWVVRLYFNPLVRLIWIGAILMGVGGALSLSDRRLRIGAPRRARRTRAAPTPAE